MKELKWICGTVLELKNGTTKMSIIYSGTEDECIKVADSAGSISNDTGFPAISAQYVVMPIDEWNAIYIGSLN